MRALGAFSPLSLSVVSGVRLLRFINSLLVAIKSGNMLGVLANGGALLFIQWCITFYRMHQSVCSLECSAWICTTVQPQYSRLLCGDRCCGCCSECFKECVSTNVQANVVRRPIRRTVTCWALASVRRARCEPFFALLRSPIFALSNFCLQINISLSSSLFLSLDCKVCIN